MLEEGAPGVSGAPVDGGTGVLGGLLALSARTRELKRERHADECEPPSKLHTLHPGVAPNSRILSSVMYSFVDTAVVVPSIDANGISKGRMLSNFVSLNVASACSAACFGGNWGS